MTRVPHTVAALAGLSLIGTLAGCSGPNQGASDAEPTQDYTDGEYSATGAYVSPNGEETIDVEVTLADNIVTDLVVTSHPTNPNTKMFQGQFVDGIAGQVVGKNIDELDVSKVAGSSLTSGGFNEAVETIKSEAA